MRVDGSKSHYKATADESVFAAYIDEARAGSSEAIGRLIDSCRAYLLLVANEELEPSLRVKVAASDLVQETILTAQVDFPRFRGRSQGELMRWLRRTLLNDLVDLRRRYGDAEKRAIAREESLAGDSRADRPARQVPTHDPTPHASSVAREEAAALQRAMAGLPDDYRQAVTLRNWERMSFAEIAQRMKRSREAVRKLWVRGIERLRDELSKSDGDATG